MSATITHAFSNAIADGTNTQIVRPSDWNSAHAITLNAVGSEISGAFGNGGGVSFGLSADGKMTAAAPAGAALINFSAGTTSGDLGAVVFSNSGGVSFGLSGSTITATVKTDYLTTARASNDAVGLNTAKTAVTWTVNSSGISLDAGAYLTTARGSTDAIGLNTAKTNVTWTANSSGLSLDAGGYAGTGTSATNASITLNTAGLAISVGAQSNQTLGLYGLGNTTQNSSTTLDARTVSLNGLGAMTVGYSNGSVQLSAPATSSLVGTNGISVSTNGSTISVLPQWVSSYENLPGEIGASQTQTLNGASVSCAVAFNVPQPLSASFIRMPVLMTTQSGTATTLASASASGNLEQYSTWNAVMYSLGTGANSQSLRSVNSSSVGFTHRVSLSITNSSQASYTHGFSAHALGGGTTMTTQYSVSAASYSVSNDGVFSSFSSNRMLDLEFANSLSPGNYVLVFGYSSSSASSGAAGLSGLTAASIAYSNHYGASQANLVFGVMGSSNMTSGFFLGAGSFSTAGGGTTNSIPYSAISSSASHVRPYFQMLRSA